MAGRSGSGPPKRERRPGQEAAHLKNRSNSNAPGYTQPSSCEQGSAASGGRYDLAVADFQRAEFAAARYLVAKYFLRPAAAKIIAASLRLAPLAEGAP